MKANITAITLFTAFFLVKHSLADEMEEFVFQDSVFSLVIGEQFAEQTLQLTVDERIVWSHSQSAVSESFLYAKQYANLVVIVSQFGVHSESVFVFDLNAQTTVWKKVSAWPIKATQSGTTLTIEYQRGNRVSAAADPERMHFEIHVN